MSATKNATVVSVNARDGKVYQVVLGLTWKRIVTAETDEVGSANATARAAKANRLLIGRSKGGGSIRIIGFGKVAKAEEQLLSAAYALQVQFAENETVIAAIRMPGDQVWVCAVSEGLVCHGYDCVLSQEEAIAKVTAFFEARQEDRDRIVTFGDFVSNSRSMTLEDLAEYASTHAVGRCNVEMLAGKMTIPKPLLIGLGAVAVLLVAREGYSAYTKAERAKALAAMEAEKVPELTQAEVWKKSLATWSESSSAVGFKSIQDAIVGIGALKTNEANWLLDSIACTRAGAAWNCGATYKRKVEARATSADFVRSVGAKSVEWLDLDTVKLVLTIPTAIARIDPTKLPVQDELSVSFMSALQRSQSVFSSVGEKPKFAAVPMPQVRRPDGTPYVVDPAGVKPLVVEAEVALSGPVRSIFALADFNISWNNFTVKLAPVEKAGPKESSVSFTDLKGSIYAVRK